MIEVNLRKLVKVDHQDDQIMVLEEANSANPRTVELGICSPEANEIIRLVDKYHPNRPTTHQMCSRIISTLGADLESVGVVKRIGPNFYAELVLCGNDGNVVVDCRPSDAVALAMRVGAPIYVKADIFDKE